MEFDEVRRELARSQQSRNLAKIQECEGIGLLGGHAGDDTRIGLRTLDTNPEERAAKQAVVRARRTC